MRRISLIISLLALCLLAPAAADAASSDTILKDCVDGQIDGSYSRSALDKARANIPSDVDEYSDCRGAIEQARVEGSANPNGSGSSGGGSGGGSSSGGGGSAGGRSSGSGGSSPAGGSSSQGASSSGGGGASPGATAGESSGAGGGAGDATPSPAVDPTVAAVPQGPGEQTAVKDAVRRGGSPVRLGPEALVVPGSTGVPASEALRRSIPDPLLAVLIILGAVALVGAILGTRARVVARRTA